MRFTVKKSFVFLLLFATSVWSQSINDSLAVQKLNWSTIKLGAGLNYKSIETALLFNSSQHISVLEINLKKKRYQIGLLTSKKGVLQKTSQIAMENNAIAAINGNFFNVKTQGAVDFVKINDTILAENFKVDSKRTKRTNGFIGVSSNSKTALIKLLDNQNELDFDFASIMSSGPMLLYDKEMVLFDQNSFSTNRHPGTCIAQKSESVLLVNYNGW